MKIILLKGLVDRIGRIYNRKEIENILKKKNEFYGELIISSSNTIDMLKLSHRFINVHFEDDDLVGELEIFNTPSGRIIEELLKTVAAEFSIRGTGYVDKNNNVTGLTIFAFDFNKLSTPFLEREKDELP